MLHMKVQIKYLIRGIALEKFIKKNFFGGLFKTSSTGLKRRKKTFFNRYRAELAASGQSFFRTKNFPPQNQTSGRFKLSIDLNSYRHTFLAK